MAKLACRRRMRTGHCHGFHWLRPHRNEPRTDVVTPNPWARLQLIDQHGFMEHRDYDGRGQLVTWRLYRRTDSPSKEVFTWAWELIEGRVYDADGKRLGTFGKECGFDVVPANPTICTFVYDGSARLTAGDGDNRTIFTYLAGEECDVSTAAEQLAVASPSHTKWGRPIKQFMYNETDGLG
jgi:hypothetical protein